VHEIVLPTTILVIAVVGIGAFLVYIFSWNGGVSPQDRTSDVGQAVGCPEVGGICNGLAFSLWGGIRASCG
jgi:hypothetical protein